MDQATSDQAASMEARAREAGLQVVDFDPEADPRFRTDNPQAAWDDIAAYGDFFYSTAARGFFVANGYQSMKDVMQDAGAFSSAAGTVAFTREHMMLDILPISVDPPEHTKYRRLLNPLFSPPVVERTEPRIRQIAARLAEECASKDSVEAMFDFALMLPGEFFLEWMGFGQAEMKRYIELALAVSYEQFESLEKKAAFDQEMSALLSEVIETRRRRPGEDLISQMLEMRIDGRPLDQRELLSMGSLLFLAGLETTAMILGFALRHFADHDDDRRRVVADPAILPVAVEELMRVYSTNFVTGRTVVKDATVAGCPMRPGDRVAIASPSVNRRLPDEDQGFQIDRWPNRHVTFSLGPHRCLGSHLARAEIRISLEEWHRCIPNYRVQPGAELHCHASFQQALSTLPLEILRP